MTLPGKRFAQGRECLTGGVASGIVCPAETTCLRKQYFLIKAHRTDLLSYVEVSNVKL